MNVIFMSSNLNGITLQIFTDSTYIIIKIVFDLVINQIFSVLCTEYNMRVKYACKLLRVIVAWQGFVWMTPFQSFFLSGISAIARCTMLLT